jgi:NAD(P)-dependent dehydrogenase (short-subunit alcohol dehydrogenase family)
MSWNLDAFPRQDNTVAVITGANSGLGLETAWMLGKLGATVVMACRNPAKAQAAVAAIQEKAPQAKIEQLALDLGSLSSIRRAAEEAKTRFPSIGLLINNAGVMAPPTRKTTEDGFELQLGTNHFGHFAWTALLFPNLASNARIVNVSSSAHQMGRMDFNNLMWEKGYGPWPSYGRSKLANLLFTYEGARRLGTSGIAMMAAHPGYAATNLQSTGPGMDGGGFSEWVMRVGNAVIAQSGERGARPTVYAAVAPDAVNGGYYGPSGLFEVWGESAAKVGSSKASLDVDAQKRLWEVSEQLTGTKLL